MSMSRALMLRFSQTSLWQQNPTGQNHRRVAAAAAAGAAVLARRGVAGSTSTPSTAAGVSPREGEQQEEEEGEEEEEEEAEGEELKAADEAAAKRAALLKRYGDRTPPAGPVAVKATTARAGAGGSFDVEKSVAAEANHNEIWGDYVRYMEHQRKKGWKT